VLAGALKRNLLLSLAEAEFYRVRWSDAVLVETERAIADLLAKRGLADAPLRASRAVAAMRRAFDDAPVGGWEPIARGLALPDPKDVHILAAAIKTRASIIVTDNLRDFPAEILGPLDIEAKSADSFLADTIGLDEARAVVAVRTMRERFRRPEKTAEALLLDMEASGLVETVDAFRSHVGSL
jgi:predicted nucleic acid-binding protein